MTHPTTVPDVLPYETLDGPDEPTSTLNGGSARDDNAILALKVQEALTSIRTTAQDAADAAARGWVPIAAGSESGVTEFEIDVTAGGTYPVGTFALMRLYLRGSTDSDAYLTLRINDSVADSHRRGWVTFRTDTGAVVDSGHGDATNARIADWAAVFSNNCQVTIFNTNISSHVSWEASSSRIALSGEFHRRMLAHGARVDGNVLVSSLRIDTASPVVDMSCRWILEGLRLP